MGERHRRILIGVTSDQSIRLVTGFPQYLRDRGWDVHVVSSPGPLLERLGAEPGITTHALAMAREPSLRSDLGAVIRWVRLLRAVRPGVTSLGTPKAALVGGLAAAAVRVPFRVYHLRGLRLESFEGRRRALFAAVERLTAATAHRVLAVSPSLLERVAGLGLIRRSKMVVLGDGSSNGVDLVDGPPDARAVRSLAQSLGLAEGVPVIGFVGRLTEDKGLGVLRDALALLERRGIAHQLLVVGGVDHTAGAGGAEVPGSTVTGQVDDPERYYPLMDLLCLPTLREGFPNVVLEAAAAGVPAVTTDATGAVDSVVPGQTGLIAAVGSAEALADRLGELLADPAARRRMGSAARERVETSFTRERVWSLSEALYAGGRRG